eukprot:UN33761
MNVTTNILVKYKYTTMLLVVLLNLHLIFAKSDVLTTQGVNNLKWVIFMVHLIAVWKTVRILNVLIGVHLAVGQRGQNANTIVNAVKIMMILSVVLMVLHIKRNVKLSVRDMQLTMKEHAKLDAMVELTKLIQDTLTCILDLVHMVQVYPVAKLNVMVILHAEHMNTNQVLKLVVLKIVLLKVVMWQNYGGGYTSYTKCNCDDPAATNNGAEDEYCIYPPSGAVTGQYAVSPGSSYTANPY